MASYGQGGPGATYNGASLHEATTNEYLKELLSYFKIPTSTQPQSDPAYLYQSRLTRMLGLPGTITGSSAANMALFQTQVKWLLGGFASPDTYVDLFSTSRDYLKSLHYIQNGSLVPAVGGSGGGGASFTDRLTNLQDDMGVVRTTTTTTAGNVTNIVNNGLALTETGLHAISSGVWQYELPTFDARWGYSQKAAWLALGDVFIGAVMQSSAVGWPITGNPYFAVVGPTPGMAAACAANWADNSDYTERPDLIYPTSILPDDTVLSYLQREQPGWAWDTLGPTKGLYPNAYIWANVPFLYYGAPEDKDIWLRCQLDDFQLQTLRLASIPTPEPPPAGGDVVTGPEHTFGGNLGVTETMAGCYVHMTTIAPKQGSYQGQTVTRYPYLGYLTFVNEQGDADGLQRLEFGKQIYKPLTIQTAAGVDLFIKAGNAGILQGWSIMLPE